MAVYGPGYVGGARRGNWLRRRILFHVLAYLIVGILFAINAVLGEPWWSLGIAAVWGGFLFLRFVVMAVLWHFMRPKATVGPRRRSRMLL